jgi:hypothetical protein
MAEKLSPRRGKIFFSAHCPEQFCDTQPIIQWVLGLGGGCFTRDKVRGGGGAKLTTHLKILLRSRICGSIYLNGVVFN